MLEFNFTPFPSLATERLVLRETNMADLDDLFKLRNNEVGLKYLDRPIESYDEVREKLTSVIAGTTKGDNILWTICWPDHPEMIGTTGFWKFNKQDHRVEIGYALFPEYWGRGIMTEANQKIITYAFGEMRVHSIAANINPENTASRRVLEKAGFRQEAHFTEDYYFDGKFTDSAIFSLLEKWFVSEDPKFAPTK